MSPHQSFATQSQIDQAAGEIDKLASHVSGGFQPLSEAQRKHLLKFRRGNGVVAAVAAIARRYGLAHPSVDVDGMVTGEAAAERLKPLAAHVRAFSQLLDDMILVAESGSWTEATVLYGMLRSLGRKNPALAADVKEVSKQLRLGKREKAPPAPQPAEPAKPS